MSLKCKVKSLHFWLTISVLGSVLSYYMVFYYLTEHDSQKWYYELSYASIIIFPISLIGCIRFLNNLNIISYNDNDALIIRTQFLRYTCKKTDIVNYAILGKGTFALRIRMNIERANGKKSYPVLDAKFIEGGIDAFKTFMENLGIYEESNSVKQSKL